MTEAFKKPNFCATRVYSSNKKKRESAFSIIEQDNVLDIDQLISAYYQKKSIEQDQSSLEFSEEGFVGSAEIVERLMTTPSVTARHLLLKLNIFENELATDIENGACIESNALILFAGIKRDVMDLLADRASEQPDTEITRSPRRSR